MSNPADREIPRRPRRFALSIPLFPWPVALVAGVVFSALGIARHHAFYSLEDTGMFAQMLWSTLHGRLFHTDLVSIGLFTWLPHNYLGDHFSPILFAFLPLYAAWPRPESLFVVQGLALATASVPLFRLARAWLGDHVLAGAFALAWLASPFVWQSNIADFHVDTLEPLFVFGGTWALLRRHTAAFLAWIVLLLLCREDTALYVAGLAAFAILHLADRRRGLAAGALALAYGGLTFAFVLPALRAGLVDRYPYLEHYSQFGASFGEIFRTFLTAPHRVIAHLGAPPVLEPAFWLGLTVLFLPLGSLAGLLLLAPSTLQKLLTNTPHIYTLSWYYSASVLPFCFVGAMAGAANVLARLPSDRARARCRRALAGLLVAAAAAAAVRWGMGVVGDFKVRMPVPALGRGGWLWATDRDAEIRRLLATVPAASSVVTTAHIVSHVANRLDVRLYPYRPLDREVVLLDVYGERSPAAALKDKCAMLRLLERPDYGVVANLDGFLYVARGHDRAANAAAARRVASVVEAEALAGDNVRPVFDLAAGNKHAVYYPAQRARRGVMYGPYVSLPAGRYEVTFRMKVRARSPRTVARLDVTADQGRRVLAERAVSGTDFREAGRYEAFRLAVAVDQPLERAEFRAHLEGGTGVWLDRVDVDAGRADLDITASWCAAEREAGGAVQRATGWSEGAGTGTSGMPESPLRVVGSRAEGQVLPDLGEPAAELGQCARLVLRRATTKSRSSSGPAGMPRRSAFRRSTATGRGATRRSPMRRSQMMWPPRARVSSS